MANNILYDEVITIHSGCTDIVSKNVADDNKMMKNIHKKLTKLSSHKNVSIEACQIAVDKFDIKDTDLHPFIKLQNDGYVFITFSK